MINTSITPIVPSCTPLGDSVLANVMLFVNLNKFPAKWNKDAKVIYALSRHKTIGKEAYVRIFAQHNEGIKPIDVAVEVRECKGSQDKFTVSFILRPGQHDFIITEVTFSPYENMAAAKSILEFILLGTMLT